MARYGSINVPVMAVLVVGAVIQLLLTGCASSASLPGASPSPSPTSSTQPSGRAIVLGNIDPGSPTRKIEEFLPLTRYLADQLGDLGIAEGKVVIARDQEEMVRLLQDGAVDIYFDAAVPSIEVCDGSQCQIVLQQWKGGEPTLYGIFVASRDSGIASLRDLEGKVIALQKSHSTVGFTLPITAMVQEGLSLTRVDGPGDSVPPGSVGYFSTGGGRNAIDMLLRGQIAAVALGERAYDRFSSDIRDRTVVFHRTVEVPSQLVSVNSSLEPEVVTRLMEAMSALDDAEGGRAIMEGMRDTRRFTPLPSETTTLLSELRDLLKLVPEE